MQRHQLSRREFITLLSGAAAWPLVAQAQQMPVICVFNSGRAAAQTKNIAALREGLKEAGFVEGRNVAIEFLWGENQFDKLPALAAEVVARKPAVIVSNTLAALAAKKARATVPIVFTTGSDPVRDGLSLRSTGPAAMSPGLCSSPACWAPSAWSSCAQLVPNTSVGAVIYPARPKPKRSWPILNARRKRWACRSQSTRSRDLATSKRLF